MPSYRFLYRDIFTGQLLGELPLESCTYGEVLNRPGSFQGTMALRPEAGFQTITSTTLKPGSTLVYVERDGVLMWGGILWTLRGDVESNALELGASGPMSYFERRLIQQTLTYSNVEQSMIAGLILSNAQAQTGSPTMFNSILWNVSPILRSRTYYSYELKPVSEAVEELAAVRDGFDFRVRVETDYSFSWVPSYPSTGRATDFVLDMDANVQLLSFTVDATTVVNSVVAKGAGEGDSGLVVTASNAPGLVEYPLLEDQVSLMDVRDTATLEAHAKRLLDRGKRATLIPEVISYAGREPDLGSFLVGDIVRVKGSYGWLSIDDKFRITEWECEVDSNGGETVKLKLAPLEVFTSA